MAIECMHNQYLCNRQISVQYAYKKDSRGERHGGQVRVGVSWGFLRLAHMICLCAISTQMSENKMEKITMYVF